MLHFTLDTSAVIHSVQTQRWASEIDAMVDLAAEGKIGLYLSTAFEIDMEKATEENRLRNLSWLQDRSHILRIPQPFRLNHSPLGDPGFVLAGESDGTVATALEAIMLRPEFQVGHLDPANAEMMAKWRRKISDVQHLAAHFMSGNDCFVSSDKDDMLKKRDAILASTDIRILDPGEALASASEDAS